MNIRKRLLEWHKRRAEFRLLRSLAKVEDVYGAPIGTTDRMFSTILGHVRWCEQNPEDAEKALRVERLCWLAQFAAPKES